MSNLLQNQQEPDLDELIRQENERLAKDGRLMEEDILKEGEVQVIFRPQMPE